MKIRFLSKYTVLLPPSAPIHPFLLPDFEILSSIQLEFEIEHAYELTVYRVFGLSLVAAIIDSICSCITLHGKSLKKDTARYQRKLLDTLRARVGNSGIFDNENI